MFCNCAYKFVLYVLGVYSVYELYKLLRYIVFNKIISPVLWKPIEFRQYGRWAVITGCTDGIGKAFTYELAGRGMNVVLISRSQQKLDELAVELSHHYNVETKVIVADFRNTNEVMPVISKELADVDIGVLVNNVGIALQLNNFLDHSKKRVNDIIEVNVKSMVFMCSLVMDHMMKKKKGVVINVSSLLSQLPAPGIATVYGATKAFVLKFSQDLHAEYKQHGIIVHCLTTGPVITKLFNVKISDWLTPTPSKYAKSALLTIGMLPVTTGYSAHDFIGIGFGCLNGISHGLYTWLLMKVEGAVQKQTFENMSRR